jgi:hypothetical protein
LLCGSVGKRWQVRFHEKGKEYEMPARYTLQDWLDANLEAAGIREDRKGWLFRTVEGHSCRLTDQL